MVTEQIKFRDRNVMMLEMGFTAKEENDYFFISVINYDGKDSLTFSVDSEKDFDCIIESLKEFKKEAFRLK